MAAKKKPKTKPAGRRVNKEAPKAESSKSNRADSRHQDLVHAINATLASKMVAGPLTLDQIKANAKNRLGLKTIGEKSLVAAIASLERSDILVRRYSLNDTVGPRPAFAATAVRVHKDLDIEDAIVDVICNPPGTVTAQEVQRRILDVYGIDYPDADVMRELDRLARQHVVTKSGATYTGKCS
jgi:hypothetical protein